MRLGLMWVCGILLRQFAECLEVDMGKYSLHFTTDSLVFLLRIKHGKRCTKSGFLCINMCLFPAFDMQCSHREKTPRNNWKPFGNIQQPSGSTSIKSPANLSNVKIMAHQWKQGPVFHVPSSHPVLYQQLRVQPVNLYVLQLTAR